MTSYPPEDTNIDQGDENHVSKQNSPRLGSPVLWRPIRGYSVYLCPIKRTPGLYGLKSCSKGSNVA